MRRSHRTHKVLPSQLLAILFLSLLSFDAFSADISREIRAGREDETIKFDGFLELSFSGIVNKMPIPGSDELIGTIGVGGNYRYKRWFWDVHAESYNQFQIGYNFYYGEDWSLDVMGAASEHGVNSELNTELKLFTEREAATFLGFRATGYDGPYILQFEALWDYSRLHSGSLTTGSIARTWLVRNWNFHTLFSARYESANTLDYQFGVDASEANEVYPEYQANAGLTFVTEFGVTYPVNEFIVLKSTARWWELPTAVLDSPFITNDSYATFSTSINFVY